MKKIMLILSTIAITALIFFACSEREHSNPLDYEWGKVEPIQTLSLESISISEIKISWTADANYPEGHQYRIDKKVGSNDWVERYKILWGNEDSSYVDTVEINQKILYRIFVTYDKNKSIEKIDSLINIFPLPTNFAVTQSSITSANLSWTDNSIGEDKFEIERKLSTESTYLKIGEVTGSDTATKNWTDQGLTANLTYDYRVRGVKGSYNSNYLTKTGYLNEFRALANLTITSNSITSATLSWPDNYIGEDKFEIERKLSTDSVYVIVQEVIGSDTTSKSWTDNTIVPGLNYNYRVRIVDGTAYSKYAAVNLLNPFQAPTSLILTQNNVYTFTLKYKDNSKGEDGFKIERKIDDGVFSLIATVTDTTFVDATVLKKGYTTVYYKVRAYKSTYFSSYIENNSSIIFSAPTNLTFTKENIYTIKLSWQETSNGEDGFKIDKKIGTSGWITGFASVGANIKTWTDSNADINANLQYRVYAFKGNNSSQAIETAVIDNTFPIVSNFTVTQASITSSTVAWSDNCIGEEKFEIERKLSTDATYVKVTEITGSDTASKTWTDTTVMPSLTYDYRIRAVKGTYTSAYVLKTGYNNLFPAPASLTATGIEGTSIKLNWTDNSTGESGYKIDRKIGSAGSWVTNYATVGSNIKTWTDTGITVGVPYTYKVRAYYSTYYSSYTSEESASIIDLTRFIAIPTGSFSMGQTGVAEPVHTVNITRDYYLGKYELTQKEWTDIMGSNQSSGYGVGDNYPVYSVSWYKIIKYCNLRSMIEGLTPCYSIGYSTNPTNWGDVPTSSNITWNEVTCNWNANGYRLPTEAEWEYAARYNDSRIYPWGADIPNSSLCNYNYNLDQTMIVGSYPYGNSKLGLCDLAGNVWEWVWDWSSSYTNNIGIDPTGPATVQSDRILRGGVWGSDTNGIRCANRDVNWPCEGSYDYGFRLAMTNTEMLALSISPQNQSVNKNSGSIKYAIKYNETWNASVDQSWCSIVNPSGSGSDSLQVNYEENTGVSSRVATITVTGSSFSKKVTLTQYSLVPTQGLVAYYPFNGNANDESSNGYNGTVNGATLTVDRFSNNNSAYSFNVNSITASPILPLGNTARSISAWFNTTSTSGSNGWNCNTVVSWGAVSAGQSCHIGIYQGKFSFGGFGIGYDLETGCYVSDGMWHHAVITYDGSFMEIYLDGNKVKDGTLSLSTASSLLHIGERSGQDSQTMDGLIDDIYIFNRVLTVPEIQYLFTETGVKK